MYIHVYIGSIKLIADFIRKYRPFCVYLRQLLPCNPPNTSSSSCGCDSNYYSSNLLICMKYEIMHDEDIDELCDAYIPIGE